jgi:hypothetical protein
MRNMSSGTKTTVATVWWYGEAEPALAEDPIRRPRMGREVEADGASVMRDKKIDDKKMDDKKLEPTNHHFVIAIVDDGPLRIDTRSAILNGTFWRIEP